MCIRDRPYTALDIVARKRRMQGYNVLYPMGWDAFGLPTENYAIKNKIHPKIVTANNVKRFKEQLHSLGYSFDWDREVNTTDPEYYKWTQWIFLKLFKAGLAYKSEMPINWCTSVSYTHLFTSTSPKAGESGMAPTPRESATITKIRLNFSIIHLPHLIKIK